MRFSFLAVPLIAVLFSVGCTSDPIINCLKGEVQCDGSCVKLADDADNCGACGTKCDSGSVCSAGSCQATCAVGLTECSGSCKDLDTDSENCGACGTVCDASPACAAGSCQSWTLATGQNDYGFADFIPQGQDPLLATSDTVYSYSVSGDTWSTANSSLSLPGGYSYPAWDENQLVWLSGGDLTTYIVATGVVNTTTIPMMPSSSDAQNTADESHNVYTMATDGTIIKYNTGTATLNTFTGPVDLPAGGDEPRLAWDKKTGKVYVGDYSSIPFYSVDTADGTLTPLTNFPDGAGMNDGFCSDRNGHIYTTDADGANDQFWTFNAVTGTWNASPLPFVVGSSGTCTVSGDGYLYLLGDGTMYKLRVF